MSKKKSSKRLRELNSQEKPAEPVEELGVAIGEPAQAFGEPAQGFEEPAEPIEDVSPTPATHAPLLRSTSIGNRGEIIVRALEIIGDG